VSIRAEPGCTGFVQEEKVRKRQGGDTNPPKNSTKRISQKHGDKKKQGPVGVTGGKGGEGVQFQSNRGKRV